MDENIKRDIKRFIVITLAAVLMAVNIKTFVKTGDLFPGGANGITLLITRSADVFFNVKLPYTLVNLILNFVPIYIGFKFIGKKFTLFSCWVIFFAGFMVDIIPGYAITEDILLISIFGGMINGTVISICLLMNATTGGTDFISIFLSEKKGVDAFNIILAGNAVVILIAGFLFGWDRALYSIIFQYVSTTVIRILYRKYQQITLFIVTDHPNDVCDMISNISNHGATTWKAEGYYNHSDRTLVYSIVSSAEADKVVSAIKKIDKSAFINLIKTQQLLGNFYRSREE
ncbi:YitT family protein [Lachnoanaerobaculum sp. Marseille-Q4761]|uniref:YitT family protein n=1 Tax=Lachnoanaerobaculum sp. Marseille-Q4761 TaxID=2819511 RepID=UPI001AA10BE0|nr:YitT family protein [Lachnoanaerobaculum sp. Marseille-Q4761]MBO1871712.1 YitT family protein [Lachnoanaerobaculum sp. Marseille-Q4761]